MELVYLWVEDYKNIKKQGFNFSPRFRCEYDDEKNELNIIDKDETGEFYPKNFFGNNVNVTAIVGENGSGKSSILELLPYGRKIIEVNKLIFLLFKKNDEYILLSSKDKKIKKNKDFFGELKEENISNSDFSNKYTIKRIIYDTDITKEDFTKEDLISFFISKIKLGYSFRDDFYEDENKTFSIEKYKQIINIFIFDVRNKFKNSHLFEPKYIKISDKNTNRNIDKKLLKITTLDSLTFNSFENEDIYAQMDIYKKFLIYVIFNMIEKKVIEEAKDLDYFNQKIEELEKLIENRNNEPYYKKLFDNLEKIKKYLDLIEFNKEISLSEFDDNYKIIFEPIIQELITIDFYDKNMIPFSSYSQGERNFYVNSIFLQHNYKNQLKTTDNENIFFLLDEPDLTLHPNWQKKYIWQLLNTYQNLGKSIHFVITTHSPFTLSDLPKENIIFLEKGKQVYPFDDGKQTFGANIHTLLSHGFFMKDGLMGEFAKDKIQSIIKYHEEILEKKLTKEENKNQRDTEKEIYEKEHKTKFWQIQSIIGDDYLKQIIKNHLIEIEKIVLGKDEAKDEEIKRLEAQIEQLRK